MRNKDNNVWLVIPARGGSKGIPRKNLREIGGRPLVGRAIKIALGAKNVDRIIVSTDDSLIAQVSKSYGAEVISRPSELSDDKASSESALLHVLSHERALGLAEPQVIVLFQCTAPLTTTKDVEKTVEIVQNGEADSAFVAVPFLHFLWREDENGLADAINHGGGLRARRQDLSPQYLEAGSIYVMDVQAFRAHESRFCGCTKMYKSEPDFWIEVDAESDLHIADFCIGIT